MARKAVFHDTGVFDDGDDTITLGGVTQDDLDAVAAAAQPVDSDLTAIAALTTTSFGRGLLALADQAALLAAAGAAGAVHVHSGGDITTGTVADARIDATIARDSEVTSAIAALSSVYQPLDSDLTAVAALTTTSYGRAFLALADAAAGRTAIGLGNVDNTADTAKPVSTAQQTALDTKTDKNAAITGATKTKITYDTKGLVTAGADATTADVADSANKRYVTDAQLTVIGNTSGANTGDQSLTGLVPKTLYDANTVLKADTDDTPVALPMGASTILARLAAGNIVAATPAELRTLLALVIGTNVQAWDADLDAIAALTTTVYGRSVLTRADAAADRAALAVDANDITVVGGSQNYVLAGADTAGASTANRNLTGLVWTMIANAVYTIDLYLIYTPTLATTGLGLAFDTSVAVTRQGLTFTHVLAATGTSTSGDAIADAASRGLSSGAPTNAVDTPVMAHGLVTCGATPGTCQLVWRPEVAAAAVVQAGATMRVTRVA